LKFIKIQPDISASTEAFVGRMSLAVTRRKRQTVQTAHHVAE